MTRLLQPLFALFAGTTDSKLAQMVEYPTAENAILRSKLPTRITLTAREKARLIKFGSVVGSAIKNLVTIVSYRTFCRWTAAVAGPQAGAPPDRRGGSRTGGEDRAGERVRVHPGLGELKKLGIHIVRRSTGVIILKDAGLDSGPKRGAGSWDEFITRHAATLWASDFVSVRTLTAGGVVDLYLLFFIHVGSRKAIASSPTANPDSVWVAQQARNATMHMAEWGVGATHLLIDNDPKFARSFDTVLEAEGCEVKRVGPRTPNMNAYAERWVQTLRNECLDHFVLVGERHLRHLVKEFVEHYNQERPHQAEGNSRFPRPTSPRRASRSSDRASGRAPEALFPRRLSRFPTTTTQ